MQAMVPTAVNAVVELEELAARHPGRTLGNGVLIATSNESVQMFQLSTTLDLRTGYALIDSDKDHECSSSGDLSSIHKKEDRAS